MADLNGRILVKRSTTSGEIPTIPGSNNHKDGSWSNTDIYKGEYFINIADGIIWTRTDNGIEKIYPDDSKADLSYVDSLMTGLWDDQGNYDASGNSFPTAANTNPVVATVKKGMIWTISVAGTPGTKLVEPGDTVRALIDNPGQNEANWAVGENNFGFTPENLVNKATNFNTLNDTLYPSVKATNDRIVPPVQLLGITGGVCDWELDNNNGAAFVSTGADFTLNISNPKNGGKYKLYVSMTSGLSNIVVTFGTGFANISDITNNNGAATSISLFGVPGYGILELEYFEFPLLSFSGWIVSAPYNILYKAITQDGGNKISATASGTDTYTANVDFTLIEAYKNFQRFYIKFTNTNTGPATINISSRGAVAIKKNATEDLVAGDIIAGRIYELIYDGTYFQISGSGTSLNQQQEYTIKKALLNSI